MGLGVRPSVRDEDRNAAQISISLYTKKIRIDVYESLHNAWTGPCPECTGSWDSNRICRGPRAINIERADLLEGSAGERLIHHPVANPSRASPQTNEHPSLEQKRGVQRQGSSNARGRALPPSTSSPPLVRFGPMPSCLRAQRWQGAKAP